MRDAKWGNSLTVRLPKTVVEALELKEDDEIEIQVMGERALEIGKHPSPKTLIARLRRLSRRLPEGFKFDRLEANRR